MAADPESTLYPTEESRFSLRAMFVLMFLVSLPLAWWAHVRFREREEVFAMERVRDLKGWVSFTIDQSQLHFDLNGSAIRDEDLMVLAKAHRLTTLKLRDTEVTDAGLEHLKNLSRLAWLECRGSRVTREGIAKLRRSIPRLETDSTE